MQLLSPQPFAVSAKASTLRPGRFEALDGVRGLASLVVFVYHTFVMYASGATVYRPEGPAVARLLLWSPLRIFWYGSSAVALFFVLSGLVQALPFFAGRAPSYGKFLIRRIFRIYVPYLVSITAAAALCLMLKGEDVTSSATQILLPWQRPWSRPYSAAALRDHVFLITNSKLLLNPVVWSLTYVLRIALVFPLLVAGARRLPVWGYLGLGIVLSVLGDELSARFEVDRPRLADWSETMVVLPMFMVGILIARHRTALTDWFVGRRLSVRIGIGLAAVLASDYYWVPEVLLMRWFPFNRPPIGKLILAFSSGALILCVLGCRWLDALLRSPGPQMLGRISFSLYLYHYTLFSAICYLLGAGAPVWTSVLLTTLACVPVCLANERWIERPSIRLGRSLTG